MPITPVPIQPILVVPGLTSATVALIFEFVDSDRCFSVKKREEETTLGGVFNTALVRLIKRRRVVARSITEIKKMLATFQHSRRFFQADTRSNKVLISIEF